LDSFFVRLNKGFNFRVKQDDNLLIILKKARPLLRKLRGPAHCR